MIKIKAIVKNEIGETYTEEIEHKRPSTIRRHCRNFEDLLRCVKEELWCDENQVIGFYYGEDGLWQNAIMKGE